MSFQSKCSISNKFCQFCEEDCSKLNCHCICTCKDSGYKNCTDLITERLNKKSSKKVLIDVNRSDEKHCARKPRNFVHCVDWQNCLKCSNHLERKHCNSFRCACLIGKTDFKRVFEKKFTTFHVNRPFFESPSRSNQNLLTNQQKTNQQIDIQSANEQHSLKMSNPNNSLILNYLSNDEEFRISLNDLQKEVDLNFKKLIRHLLSSSNDKKILFSDLNKSFENSIKNLREFEEKSNRFQPYDPQIINRLNYNLDQCLNRSFRNGLQGIKQNYGTSQKAGNRDDLRLNYTKVDKEKDFHRMNKLEMFIYLSLFQCNQIYGTMERSLTESKDAIRNLILFVNTKRIANEELINPNLKLYLRNRIDTIELNEKSSFCSKLFKTEKFFSYGPLFRFLNFLILYLNDDSIEPFELRLDKLLVLSHLEIYGKQFNFKRGNWSNSSLVNLILHDKFIKNMNILEFFPNLAIIKIQNSSGDLLKSNSRIRRLTHSQNAHQTRLRVIAINNLSLDDFFFIIKHCKNVEMIEFTLLDQAMIILLKYLPNLKFIFLRLKEMYREIGDTLAYSIYHHLIQFNSVNKLNYSNQLYCPDEIDYLNREPCFLNSCTRHSKSIKSNSNESINEKLKTPKSSSSSSSSKFEFKNRLSRSTNDLIDSNYPSSSENSKSVDEIESLKRINSFFDKNFHNSKFTSNGRIKYKKLISKSNLKTNNLKQLVIYLDRIKLVETSARKFGKFYEIKGLMENHLKISELNRLMRMKNMNAMMKSELMKELQFKCIEIDELIDLECFSILPSLISHPNSLVIRSFDPNTIENLIEKMKYLKAIKFYNIEINRETSDQLKKIFNRFLKELNKIEIHYDINDQEKACSIEFLKECESLTELKIINASVQKNDLIDLLTKNNRCTNVVLSYPVSKLDQFNIVEILSFNAIVHRNLNFNLQFNKSDFLDGKLLANFIIKG